MKPIFLNLIILLFLLLGCSHHKNNFNGSMEMITGQHKPVGWTWRTSSSASVLLDSLIKKDGKYSLCLNSDASGDGFMTASYVIPKTYKGQTIELKGYLKTKAVEGFAGLWLRVDGIGGPLAFDNMQKQGLTGTHDWQEYRIQLPYNDDKATSITLGGLVVGTGKMWLDGLKLYIDDKPIDQVTPKLIERTKAQQDTAFAKRSNIDTILLNEQRTHYLKLLGEVWGLVKYHHPMVAKGNYNMDAELFRVLPDILKTANNAQFSAVLEKWVDKFGRPAPCRSCKLSTSTNLAQKPDYGSIFISHALSSSLTNKLKYIIDNADIQESYYVELTEGVGNPVFKNELPYATSAYPDAGFRLLALYRYWNMIQYFYPYKHLIGKNWDNTLNDYIPEFLAASNTTDYLLSALKLISSLHDTHANIWSFHPKLENYRGRFAVPLQAQFIENKLVITGYYTDMLQVKQQLNVGDIISRIEGLGVEELIRRYLPVTAASNYATQLRDMPLNYLLRSNKDTLALDIVREGRKQSIIVPTLLTSQLKPQKEFRLAAKAPAYKVLQGGIGYLYPGKYRNQDLPEIKKAFEGTKGIVVDMRCYPSDFMPFTFVPYVKTGYAGFVKFAVGSISHPGLFEVGTPLANDGTGEYKGKVVIIVNEQTQSQAEYTTMAFQSSPNVIVIGSTTAGADGNVSDIFLPGGIKTMISGIGILYPDGTETQRKGIKINYQIQPTLQGIKTGKDELLEKAMQIINTNQ